MEQREIDNMLLSMIQKHFPSLPLSDEHTDWGKWLGFARAVYEAGRASPASATEGWKLVPVVPTHAILDVMFDAGIDRHDGDLTILYRAILAAAPTPPVSEDRWQPIETAPKDGSKFLAWRRHSTLPLIVFYNAEYDQYECNDGHLVFSLTHWLPLPKAPAMEGK